MLAGSDADSTQLLFLNTGPALMGVINITPDSFSDGGLFLHPDAALEHAKKLVAAGAAVLDFGAESSRPGASALSPLQEQKRLMPVLEAICSQALPTLLSVDTRHAETAKLALSLGVHVINDISGHPSEALVGEVVRADAHYVLMHNAESFVDMHEPHRYDDTAASVCAFLSHSLEHLVRQGLKRTRILVDPGLGFAKNAAQNWAVLQGLEAIVSLGQPVLLGPSRKRFIKEALADGGFETTLEARDRATAALCALAVQKGIHVLRVHNVKACREAMVMAQLWQGTNQRVGRTR